MTMMPDYFEIAARIAANYPWPIQDILPLVQITSGDEPSVRAALDDGQRTMYGDETMPVRYAMALLANGWRVSRQEHTP